MLALLERPEGATLVQLRQVSGWQPHSVRGFLSGMTRKMGLAVTSARRADRTRVYAIRGAFPPRPAFPARAGPQAGIEAEAWPTPRPLPALLAEVGAFDPGILPPALRPWVVDLAERLQVPADYPAAALLVMLAGALGRRALMRPQRKDPWVVTPNLWGALIGRSGVLKSPVLRAVLAPLRRRQALAMTVFDSERDADARPFPTARTAKRIRRLASPAAQYAQDVSADCPGDVPPPPVCTRYLINEATIEKVHLILKDNPQGVLFLRDELSGWMAPLEQRGRERERAFFLEAWDGDGDFVFDRVGRGTVYASHLCLSVLGGLQPARLREYVAEAVTGGAGDDGFMQRFQVLVWPDIEPDWEDIDRLPDSRAEWRVDQMVERLLELSPEDPFRAHFNGEAQEVFSAWRKELEQKIRSGDLEPALESHLAKSRSLLPKLALLLHLAEGSREAAISLETACRAARLCGYLENHARRAYGSVASRPLRLAASLVERLRKGVLGNRFSLADVYLRGWAGLDTAEQARLALGVLVDAAWVRAYPAGDGTKAAFRSPEYVVNPAVYPV